MATAARTMEGRALVAAKRERATGVERIPKVLAILFVVFSRGGGGGEGERRRMGERAKGEHSLAF